jgi:hypothetical protein
MRSEAGTALSPEEKWEVGRRSQGLRPYTLDKARQFGFDQAYLEACL